MIAGIIHDITNMDAVAVTDREKIIAFIGAGADHHTAGQAIAGQATREALQNGQALGSGFAYPLTITQVAQWTRAVEARGYQLAPASALTRR